MNVRVVEETGLTGAEEILYPEVFRYLSDLLSYAAVGARSSEDQLHRMIASGVGIPVGMKNPTSGDLSVMLNSVAAAQHEQEFCSVAGRCAPRATRWRILFCAVMLTPSATASPTTIMRC